MKLKSWTIIFSLSFIACGYKDASFAVADPVNAELTQEINRIEPQLLWCDGGVALARPNDRTGTPNCGVGDGMHFTGIILSSPTWTNYNAMINSIRNSISPEGRPFRAPSYLQIKDPVDSFSRDQLMGLIHYLITSHDNELAERFRLYLKNNDHKLCPTASDNRCELLITEKELINDVYAHLGMSTEYHVNRWLDEQTTIIEAKTVSKGYQMNLVAQKVFLEARLGRLTRNYASAVSILRNRQPDNLQFVYLDNLLTNYNEGVNNYVGNMLLPCLRSWTTPGTEWVWSKEDIRCEGSAGHELVWLAKLVVSHVVGFTDNPETTKESFVDAKKLN